MIKIIYEDENVLVVDKPCGVVVHPDAHHQEKTVLHFVKAKLNFNDFSLNQGIVHRLDKAVSGLMIVARNQDSWDYFKKALKAQKITRKYYALVRGVVEWEVLKVDVPLLKPGKQLRAKVAITGKPAITYLKVVKKWVDKTLLACQLTTGRTHQIRIHLKFIGHPIINDPLYHQGKDGCVCLYSYFLAFQLPNQGKVLEFKKPVPAFFNVN